MPYALYHRAWINDRSGVHQQLNSKCDEVLKIAVLGSKGRNQHPNGQAQYPHEHKQKRKHQNVPGRLNTGSTLLPVVKKHRKKK